MGTNGKEPYFRHRIPMGPVGQQGAGVKSQEEARLGFRAFARGETGGRHSGESRAEGPWAGCRGAAWVRRSTGNRVQQSSPLNLDASTFLSQPDSQEAGIWVCASVLWGSDQPERKSCNSGHQRLPRERAELDRSPVKTMLDKPACLQRFCVPFLNMHGAPKITRL